MLLCIVVLNNKTPQQILGVLDCNVLKCCENFTCHPALVDKLSTITLHSVLYGAPYLLEKTFDKKQKCEICNTLESTHCLLQSHKSIKVPFLQPINQIV